jgi:actin-like ATPase involved in cell morphogenesis
MAFVAHDLGIDLGTSNTLVFVKGKGIVVNEPTIVVVESTNERKVRAVGDDAKIMLGRTTEGVMAVRPMREGVITDFDMTQILLQYFSRKAVGSSYLLKPRLFLTYPCSISSIEQRAVMEAARVSGGRKVYLVEKPFAAALGSGLPVFDPSGCMIVDIGGGTTDVSVISLGGVVLSHSIRVGGVKMDEAIINFIKREFNILIGDRTAEEVKLDLAAGAHPWPRHGHQPAADYGNHLHTNLRSDSRTLCRHFERHQVGAGAHAAGACGGRDAQRYLHYRRRRAFVRYGSDDRQRTGYPRDARTGAYGMRRAGAGQHHREF